MKNGLNTGITAFDEIVGEIQQGDLIVIAGRPGMGKTTLALQILAKNCLDKKCVYLSSLDNTINSYDYILCILGNLNHYTHEKEVKESVDKVIENKLNKTLHLWEFAFDFISLSIELTKLKTEKGLDYVFIDGFHQFCPDISTALRAKWLKSLAQSLNLTIFVTTQVKFSRDRGRIDCTTLDFHLYNCADKVLGVHRKDFYMTIDDIGQIQKGESFLCAIKNTTGALGAVTAYFNYERYSFNNSFFN